MPVRALPLPLAMCQWRRAASGACPGPLIARHDGKCSSLSDLQPADSGSELRPGVLAVPAGSPCGNAIDTWALLASRVQTIKELHVVSIFKMTLMHLEPELYGCVNTS